MLSVFLIAGCLVDHDTYNDRRLQLSDDDGDGWTEVDGDCDDADPNVHPQGTEVCDGYDNDCDGLTDDLDDSLRTDGWFVDNDNDGYGGSPAGESCLESEDWVDNTSDCDDSDDNISPDAVEVCNDFADNNCNSDDDECRLIALHNASSADTAIFPPTGTQVFGEALVGIGDSDADGLDDFAVSAPASNAVYFLSGADLDSIVDLTSASPAIVSTGPGVNNLGMAATLADRTSVFGDPAVVVGSDSAIIWHRLPVASQVMIDDVDGVVSLNPWDEDDVAEIGPIGSADINSDGIDEVIVGQLSRDYTVEIVLFNSSIWDSETAAVAGLEVSTLYASGVVTPRSSSVVGDIAGTGLDYACVAAPLASGTGGTTGLVYLFELNSSLPGAADVEDVGSVIEGENPGDAFGLAVCRSPGDVNGDGYQDVVVGAPFGGTSGTATGTAYVFFGPVGASAAEDADLIVDGSLPDDFFGVNTGEAGDLDGDGAVDLAIGAPQTMSDNRGLVHVFYGPFDSGRLSADDADFVVQGDRNGDALGFGGFVGDINGDGRSDLLATSTTVDDNAGAAYLFLGSGI